MVACDSTVIARAPETNPDTTWPDSRGRYGPFGGRYVPEVLIPALEELTVAYAAAREEPSFQRELDDEWRQFAGRPTALMHAGRYSAELGANIYLKREDLAHTGAHKINNALGQVLLARRMGKRRLIAETGAGQHGVATATVAARYGMPCTIYMGELDTGRQRLNVMRMRMLGADVVPVKSGSRTLKDAINEAIRDWVTNVGDTFYLIGSVVGPHPYPMLVRDFQSVIGRESRRQILYAAGCLPDYVVACVGGGSNAIGMFHAFLNDATVKLIGVEAAGEGVQTSRHAATLSCGRVGVLHGAMSYVLQNPDGQIQEAHSVSAGLDYPGVGPEHSFLKEVGRVEYVTVGDREALAAFTHCAELEGILPALEAAHALAYLPALQPRLDRDDVVLVCLSGRGDKDVDAVQAVNDGGA